MDPLLISGENLRIDDVVAVAQGRKVALDPAVPDGLLISGFWNAFLAPVSATLSGDAITIDRQEPDADSYFVQGSAVEATPGTLGANYRITGEDDPTAILTDICQSTWTKQEGI